MQGRPVKLLVICSNRENYFKLLGGRADVAVDQAPWLDVVGVVSFTDSLVVHLGPQKEPFTGTPQTGARSFSPDIVLLRSFVLGAPGHDWRTLMAGFMHANVECINSLDSFAFSVEKEKLWGRMRQCRDDDPTFPLISDCYYSGSRVASFFNESGFPLVVKLGSASQGVGKSQVKDAGGWKDTLSLLAMMDGTSGFTAEPCVPWVSDLRLQKIGSHYRAIRRFKTGQGEASWKANEAFGIDEEDVPMETRWREWCDVAARVLKMDILGLDLLVDKEGREYVLECNSSSIGFPPRHRDEDLGHIVEVLNVRIAQVARRLTAATKKRNLLKDAAAGVADKKTAVTIEALASLLNEFKTSGSWDVALLKPAKKLAVAGPAVRAALVLLVAQCFAQQHQCNTKDAHIVASLISASVGSIAAVEPAADAYLIENTLQLAVSELNLLA